MQTNNELVAGTIQGEATRKQKRFLDDDYFLTVIHPSNDKELFFKMKIDRYDDPLELINSLLTVCERALDPLGGDFLEGDRLCFMDVLKLVKKLNPVWQAEGLYKEKQRVFDTL